MPRGNNRNRRETVQRLRARLQQRQGGNRSRNDGDGGRPGHPDRQPNRSVNDRNRDNFPQGRPGARVQWPRHGRGNVTRGPLSVGNDNGRPRSDSRPGHGPRGDGRGQGGSQRLTEEQRVQLKTLRGTIGRLPRSGGGDQRKKLNRRADRLTQRASDGRVGRKFDDRLQRLQGRYDQHNKSLFEGQPLQTPHPQGNQPPGNTPPGNTPAEPAPPTPEQIQQYAAGGPPTVTYNWDETGTMRGNIPGHEQLTSSDQYWRYAEPWAGTSQGMGQLDAQGHTTGWDKKPPATPPLVPAWENGKLVWRPYAGNRST